MLSIRPLDMLEYFLFYFAYALTLDDDDCNGRGMRRVRVKQCLIHDSFSTSASQLLVPSRFTRLFASSIFTRPTPSLHLGLAVLHLVLHHLPPPLAHQNGHQGQHQNLLSRVSLSTVLFSTCIINISTISFLHQSDLETHPRQRLHDL